MMINIHKKYLAVAVGGALGLVVYTAQAEDFNASATLQNTLSITVLQDFDIGTVFATSTGVDNEDGVGGIIISPAGVVTAPATLGTVSLTSLSTPVPAQGSVAIAADFTLQLPDTSTILTAEFDGSNTGAIYGTIADETTGVAIPLVHESANPSVPNLYMMHFTIGDVSGGTSTDPGDDSGTFAVEQDFGATEFVFNIGATVTTQPGEAGATDALLYQEGVYSGIFTVTASY